MSPISPYRRGSYVGEETDTLTSCLGCILLIVLIVGMSAFGGWVFWLFWNKVVILFWKARPVLLYWQAWLTAAVLGFVFQRIKGTT